MENVIEAVIRPTRMSFHINDWPCFLVAFSIKFLSSRDIFVLFSH